MSYSMPLLFESRGVINNLCPGAKNKFEIVKNTISRGEEYGIPAG